MRQLWIGILLCLILLGCQQRVQEIGSAPAASAPPVAAQQVAPPELPIKHTNIAEMARSVAAGLGKVSEVHEDGKGAPILIVAENHGSRHGQLRQAVILTKAYDHFGLRTIVLEGYSEGNIEKGAERIRASMQSLTKTPIEDIAAGFVAEGELTAAEYLTLINADIQIVKGEAGTTPPFNSYDQDHVISVSNVLLAKLAAGRVPMPLEEVLKMRDAKITELLESIESPNTETEKVLKWCERVIAKDPWASKHFEDLFGSKRGKKIISIEQELAIMADVEREATRQSSELAELAQSTFRPMTQFLSARSIASDYMAQVALQKSRASNAQVIAVIVGAAHTEKMAKLLADGGSAFAVVRSMESATNRTRTDFMQIEQYESKVQGKSVSMVLGGLLSGEVALTRNRPRPVIEQEWMQAKGELYALADGIVRELNLGANRGGKVPPEPPLPMLFPGIPDDKFHGGLIWIDKNKLERVEQDGRSVLIAPVLYKPDHGPEKTIWIKLGATKDGRADVVIPGLEKDSSKSELALRRRLDGELKIKAGKEHLRKATEVEQIVISRKTVMMVASSRTELIKTSFQY